MFEINFTALNLGTNWFLFIFFFLLMISMAILIPRFLVNFFVSRGIKSSFLTGFVLSIITSLPEILTFLGFVVFTNQSSSGITKAFSNIVGSNWITTIAFVVVLFLLIFYFKKIHQSKLAIFISGLVFSLNLFFFLVFLFPQSFLNYFFSDFKLVSFFFLLIYLGFIVYMIVSAKKKQKTSPELTINLFKYHHPPFLTLTLLVIFIVLLVTSFFFLIPLSNFLQNKYDFSNQSIGGLFFASATSSTEIWTCLSLFFAGLGGLGLMVIIESHLFNLTFYVGFAFFSQKDIYQILMLDFSLLIFILMILSSFFLFIYSFSFHQKKKVNALLLSFLLLFFSFWGLIKLV